MDSSAPLKTDDALRPSVMPWPACKYMLATCVILGIVAQVIGNYVAYETISTYYNDGLLAEHGLYAVLSAVPAWLIYVVAYGAAVAIAWYLREGLRSVAPKLSATARVCLIAAMGQAVFWPLAQAFPAGFNTIVGVGLVALAATCLGIVSSLVATVAYLVLGIKMARQLDGRLRTLGWVLAAGPFVGALSQLASGVGATFVPALIYCYYLTMVVQAVVLAAPLFTFRPATEAERRLPATARRWAWAAVIAVLVGALSALAVTLTVDGGDDFTDDFMDDAELSLPVDTFEEGAPAEVGDDLNVVPDEIVGDTTDMPDVPDMPDEADSPDMAAPDMEGVEVVEIE